MIPLLLLLTWVQTPAQTPALMGGGAALRLLETRKVTNPMEPATDIRSKIRTAGREIEALPPEEAARRWFDLFSTTEQNISLMREIPVDDTFSVLPGPASWPAIAKIAAEKPEDETHWACGLAMAAITGDQARVADLLDKQIPRLKAVNGRSEFRNPLLQLQLNIALKRHDLKSIDDAVNGLVQLRDISSLNLDSDLQKYVGEAKAKEILRILLTKGRAALWLGSDGTTPHLARAILRENFNQVKVAQWELIKNEEGADLFPKMLQRFPVTNSGTDSEETGARLMYSYHLFTQGKSQDAVKLLHDKSQPGRDPQSYAPISFYVESTPKDQAKWLAFLSMLADRMPERVDWGDELRYTKDAESRKTLLAKLKKSVNSPEGSNKSELRSTLVDVLLADDHVDEAVPLLQKAIRKTGTGSSDGRSAELLTRIGYLMNRPDWIRQGAEALPIGTEMATRRHSRFEVPALLDILASVRMERKAEDLIVGRPWLTDPKSASTSLLNLVLLYRRLNRPVDLLQVVEGSHSWPVKDLSKIYFDQPSSELHTYPSFGTKIAWALAEVGRGDEAFKVIQPSLHLNPGYDEAYEVLLKVKGADAIPILDQLAQHDRFQERPLIWKAEELRRLGRLSEAEVAAKAAVAIDPADGDQYHGDRMRGYVVLSDILKAEGKLDEAAEGEAIVKATRIAEKAEDFLSIGMTKRALDTFRAALAIAPGIYGIEYRYAVQLNAYGEKGAAAVHFMRAFQAMTNGLGTVESYGIGAEGAFFEAANSRLAEETLSAEVSRNPQSASAHYMLGKVLKYLERNDAAAAQFLEATRLNPDHVNAWAELLGVSENLPDAKKIEALQNIMRLDPYQLHFAPDVETYNASSDQVWNVVHSAFPKDSYELPTEVFPLHCDNFNPESAFEQDDFGNPPINGYLSNPNDARIGPHRPGSWVAGMDFTSQVLTVVRQMVSAKFQRTGMQ